MVLKCGPFLGHKAVEEFSYDPGGGHVHPDANHFVVFAAGEWLRARRRLPRQVDRPAQHAAGRRPRPAGRRRSSGSRAAKPLAVKARPRIVRAESTPTLDHIVGDATAAYPAELGLERFQRHLLFVKPDVLVVVDDIAADAAPTGQPRELELRFHPEQPTGRREGNAMLFAGKKASLRLEPLGVEPVGQHGGRRPELRRPARREGSDHVHRAVAPQDLAVASSDGVLVGRGRPIAAGRPPRNQGADVDLPRGRSDGVVELDDRRGRR